MQQRRGGWANDLYILSKRIAEKRPGAARGREKASAHQGLSRFGHFFPREGSGGRSRGNVSGDVCTTLFGSTGLITLKWSYVVIFAVLTVLVFAMSCLGAFVHPLRLTFVEYFKNSGYEGKGLEYNPLTKEMK